MAKGTVPHLRSAWSRPSDPDPVAHPNPRTHSIPEGATHSSPRVESKPPPPPARLESLGLGVLVFRVAYLDPEEPTFLKVPYYESFNLYKSLKTVGSSGSR